MKNLLLHIGDDPAMQARLQVALDLARANDGHITCLQTLTYAVLTPGDFYGSAIAAAMPAIKQESDAHRKAIESRLQNEDVSWEWVFMYGMAETRLLEYSALADLILVGPYDEGEADIGRPSMLAGSLVLHGAAPVLVVPAKTQSFAIGAPALVAWNGSAEACVALRAALPLLKNANRVYLANVSEEKDKERFDFPSLEGAQYLSRYGVDSELLELAKGDGKVADVLASAAQLKECGLMVMGAYGHSRLSEMLFGGVTRRALTNPQVPVLIAH